MTTRVVVIGGGYGGLAFVRRLLAEHVDAAITLIDQNPYHTVLTEIHQVAAGLRAPEAVRIPLASIKGVHFHRARVTDLDVASRRVITTVGTIPYDLLVVALGSLDTDYGVPGVREHALTLHSMDDALAIRDRLDQLGDGAQLLIAGGGLTGVELAAAIALRPDGRRPGLTLIEAAPALLPGLAPELQAATAARLQHLGVTIHTGARIAAVDPGQVRLVDGRRIPFDLMVWACGVKANPLIAKWSIPVDHAGRAIVDDHLATPLPDLYVIGDCAAGAPPTAQVANQHGTALAVRIAGKLRGESKPAPAPRLQGVLVDLGHAYAVGAVGPLSLTGWLPALLKRFTVLKWLWRAGRLSAATRYLSPIRTGDRAA